jgi:multiple sugar transport system substrate-binding protein
MTMVYAKYYASGGGIAPLDDQIKSSGLDLNAYVPAVTEAYTVDGKVYGIPKDVNGFGLCYNKLLFDAAGVKYPDESWTWSDVIAAAQKLTKPKQGVYGFVAPEADELSWYLTVPQTGGQVISPDGKSSGYDQPATIKGIEFWTDMISKYHVSPTLQQTTETDPLAMLTSGKVAMRYCGSWEPEEIAAVPYGKANIDVAPLPAGPDGNRSYYSNGLANSMSAKTEHPEQTWEFLRFLGSERAAEIQAKTGTVIPAYQGHAAAYAKAMPEFDLQVFVDHLKYAQPFPSSTNTSVWRDDATKQFADAWTGKASVAEVSRRVAQAMNDALSKEER